MFLHFTYTLFYIVFHHVRALATFSSYKLDIEYSKCANTTSDVGDVGLVRFFTLGMQQFAFLIYLRIGEGCGWRHYVFGLSIHPSMPTSLEDCLNFLTNNVSGNQSDWFIDFKNYVFLFSNLVLVEYLYFQT